MSVPHTYGYQVDDTGELVTGPCITGAGLLTCFQPTSNQCHGEFYCVMCLGVHAEEVRATGQDMTFVGRLNTDEEVGQ